MNSRPGEPGADLDSSLKSDPFFGRMNDPTGSAFVVGLCGDEMEFYLDIRQGRIAEAKYYTNGCEETRQCGRGTAQRATGRLVMDALAISRPRRTDGQTTRACLCCRKPFVSTGAHHRLCACCRTLSKTPFDF